MRLLLIAVLALAPAAALAQACRDHSQPCAAGLIWDPLTRSCVEQLIG